MSLDIYGIIKCSDTCDCEVFEYNITSNLSRMADAAGCYIIFDWETQGKKAKELIEPLKKAIHELETYPEKYDQYNASNGWGTRVQFIPWLERLLQSCIDYPEAIISISK